MSNSTPLRFHKYVAGYLPKGGRGVLLNAGCGTGNLNQIGLEYEIHNCDVSVGGYQNFKQADLNGQWPYPDNRFDAIVSTEVIEHVENPWHFIREVKRVMKPSGLALITTPNNESERAKKAYARQGRFPWFQNVHVISQLRHITPVFKWQMEFICEELKLKLKTHTWTPQEDMVDDNWIFEIRK